MDTLVPGRAFALALVAFMAAGSALAQEQPHQARQALDDRTDTRIRSDDVGKGSHYARKATLPGAYFNDRSRQAVRSYYASHQPSADAGARRWEIGRPLPAAAAAGPVPEEIAGHLPKLPPGHRYVQLGGDILLIATRSKMVVDGIQGH